MSKTLACDAPPVIPQISKMLGADGKPLGSTRFINVAAAFEAHHFEKMKQLGHTNPSYIYQRWPYGSGRRNVAGEER